jgi:hypothetical protein
MFGQEMPAPLGVPGAVDVPRLLIVASSVRWFFLIVIHGVFIPNTWRRCALVVGSGALLPLVLTPLGAWAHGQFSAEEARDLLDLGVLLSTGHGVPAGAKFGGAGDAPRPARSGPGHPLPAPGMPGAARGPRDRAFTPGHQAEQYHYLRARRGPRRGQAAGLRAGGGAGAGPRRRPADRPGHGAGLAAVPVAGAGGGGGRPRRPLGHLQPGWGGLLAASGPSLLNSAAAPRGSRCGWPGRRG